MQVIRDNPGTQLLESSVVTIGNFDGLHFGHQELIRRCQSLADGTRPCVVISFEPLPHAWFSPDTAPARLMSVRQKLDCLEKKGIDLVWLMRFNQDLASMTADEFVQSVLVKTLAASHLVVGEDFRYGKGRQGDIDSLRRSGEKLGFEVHTVPMLDIDGLRASSTNIRNYLAAGEFEKAEHLLGRSFRMSGRVIRGRQLGRELGYPTANLRLPVTPSPLSGIFAIRARWDDHVEQEGVEQEGVEQEGVEQEGVEQEGGWHDGVANLGTRPAVAGVGFLVEAHIFDYNGNLYGRRLEIEFIKKLRDEAHFEDLDDLVAQMREDERQARICLRSG